MRSLRAALSIMIVLTLGLSACGKKEPAQEAAKEKPAAEAPPAEAPAKE